MLLNKEYWKTVIYEIEDAAHQKMLKDIIRDYDLSVTLPDNLRDRIKKIMPYEFDEYDRLVYIDDSEVETPKSYDLEEAVTNEEAERIVGNKKADAFHEGTPSEIGRMENEFANFEMKLDTRVKRKAKAKKQYNWTSSYICKPRRERVKWDSKIYHLERSLAEKTLDEQAEQLMDASAERFTEWLNSLGSNREADITKAQLKALFSIEGDRRQASIQTETKEVKAIDKAVAENWNLPEMAIDLQYENNRDVLKNVPKKVVKVAFGRTVPYEGGLWEPMTRDQKITTVFPDELLSGSKLFKGIGHLRSVKALIEFYRERPHLKRPQYLEKRGLFKMREKATTKQEIPLYELLKLDY